MTRRDDHDHYGDRKPDPSLQLTGTMFDPAPETDRARLEREASIDARFKLFHADNPHIYRELQRRAQALLDRGAKRIGIAAIVEAMRYDAAIESKGDQWKINNDYRSRYSRMLLDWNPQLRGVLDTRELRSA